MPQIVFASQDDGTLYPKSAVDVDERGLADGYDRYELPDVVTLTAAQCCGRYGSMLEILLATSQARRA